MMNDSNSYISLVNVGKRYNYNWIFKNVKLTVHVGEKIALLGANGSGKSTLLQCLASYQTISEGEVNYYINGIKSAPESHYKQISISAPYQELIDDFTFEEMLLFHFSIKSPLKGISLEQALELSGLKKMRSKRLLYFSSGMRQRVKLIMAILSESNFLFLDEPCANLDAQSMNWYRNIVNEFGKNRGIVVCSNHQKIEYDFCEKVYEINENTLKRLYA
jgi:ABC-type multidrug transport system ATPase subunit